MKNFELGQMLITKGVHAATQTAPALADELTEIVKQYSAGDVYVITELDRSATTIMFCDEY